MTPIYRENNLEASIALVHLVSRTFVCESDFPKVWGYVERHASEMADALAPYGLRLEIDQDERYAVLRQSGRCSSRYSAADDDSDEYVQDIDIEECAEIPPLTGRRPLTPLATWLLLKMRRRLAEHDGSMSETPDRLVVDEAEIFDMCERAPSQVLKRADEKAARKSVQAEINKIHRMGFLRRETSPDGKEKYEIHRILKAFVGGEWLERLEEILDTFLEVRDREESEEEVESA